MITAKFRGRTQLDAIRDILRHPFAQLRGRLALRRIRAEIEREFVRGAGFISGPWAPTQPFGSREGTTPPLGGASSSLLAAYKGGPGGTSSVTPSGIRITVTLPYARIHREGGEIPVTPRMRGFLRHKFGVNLLSDTTKIKIPARPHVDLRAPEYVAALRGVLAEAITEAPST